MRAGVVYQKGAGLSFILGRCHSRWSLHCYQLVGHTATTTIATSSNKITMIIPAKEKQNMPVLMSCARRKHHTLRSTWREERAVSTGQASQASRYSKRDSMEPINSHCHLESCAKTPGLQDRILGGPGPGLSIWLSCTHQAPHSSFPMPPK